MMTKGCAEGTCEIANSGRFINQFPQKHHKIDAAIWKDWQKICGQKMSIKFNYICMYILLLYQLLL